MVDDNAFNLFTLQKIIESNHKVLCDVAENGYEAFQKFKANREKDCCTTFYQLVLTDLEMPVMDGV